MRPPYPTPGNQSPSLTIPAAEVYVSSEEHVFVERTTSGAIGRLTIPHPHLPPPAAGGLPQFGSMPSPSPSPFVARTKTVTLHYYRETDPAWATVAVGGPTALRCPLEYLTLGYGGHSVIITAVRVKVGGLPEQALARHVQAGLETWRFPSPGPLVPQQQQQGGGAAAKLTVAVAVDLSLNFSGATAPYFTCSCLVLSCGRAN